MDDHSKILKVHNFKGNKSTPSLKQCFVAIRIKKGVIIEAETPRKPIKKGGKCTKEMMN
jgi:hypothetical protein